VRRLISVHATYMLILHRRQRKYANQIKPIRQNGHLLLVTLLLANMIVNESLPVISDPILGGGVQSVIVSTILIVM
jgi:metal transporter CNNM